VNIFVLDEDPTIAAHYVCDSHCVKMILESAQMLCAVHPEGTAPYKRSYYNHPCTKWARESSENYDWLIRHAYALCAEYSRRYVHKSGKPKIHKSQAVIEWCDEKRPELPNLGLTEHPKCMPDYCKTESVVESYRNYYINEKSHLAYWRKMDTPEWYVVDSNLPPTLEEFT